MRNDAWAFTWSVLFYHFTHSTSSFNPFLHIYSFRKTLWKKVKWLKMITSIFSFSHSVLYPIFPFPNKPWFLRVCSRSLLKTLQKKEKLLVTINSSFSHNVCYRFEELFAIFINFEIVVCKLFQLEKSNFVVWERVRREIIILTAFNFSSANAFNLVMSKILSFGKGLNPHFRTPSPFDHSLFLDRTKLRAFAEDKLFVAVMMFSLFYRVENFVVKRRKCWQPFSPFSHIVFQSLLSQGR